MSLLILVAMLVLTWALFVRPQQQRLKRQRQLVSSLAPGARVVTAGGMIGTITAVDAHTLEVELAPGVAIRMLPGAVTRPWEEPGVAGAPDDDLEVEAADEADVEAVAVDVDPDTEVDERPGRRDERSSHD